MTQFFNIKARLHSIIPVRRATNEIIFVSSDALTDDFKKLASKPLTLQVAESNGHIAQAALPLPEVTSEKPTPETVIVKGQPIGKPRMTAADRFLVGDRARPRVARYYAWADRARRAFDFGKPVSKLPKNIERLDVKFFFSMPLAWPEKKRLQHDGKPHFLTPDLDNCIKSVMDSLLDNDEIVAEIHAAKFWTMGEGYTEITFS